MLARKSLLIITNKIIDGGLGYVGLFFIARYMSPTDYGIVSFAMGYVTLFSIFINLGFVTAHVKRVSERKNLGRCIGTFLSIRAGLITLASLLLFGSLYFWTEIFGRGFESSEHLAAIYIISLYWIFSEVVKSFSSTFQAKKEIAKLQVPFLMNGIVRTSAIIYVALMGYGALNLAWTYVLGGFAHLIFVIFFFRKYPINRPTKSYIKSYGVFAFPLIVVTSSVIIMNNLDRVLIQLFWSAEDVGYYFAAFRLSKFISLATAAIVMLIFPTFSHLHINGNLDSIKRLLRDAERHLSLIVFPMVFGLVVLAEPVADILLSEWLETAVLIQILTFYALFLALAAPYEALFNGINKPQINRNRVIIMFTINIILNFILIPRDIQLLGGIKLFGLGARGAAIATVISYFVSLVYTRIKFYRLFNEKGNPRVLKHAFASLAMSGVIYYLLYQIELINFITRWYHLLLFGLLSIGIYFGILILIKEFTKQDFWYYIDIFNLKKMYSYINDEFKRK